MGRHRRGRGRFHTAFCKTKTRPAFRCVPSDCTMSTSLSLIPRLDELLPLCVVFRTPYLEDETLKSYLDRLAVNLDVYALGTVSGPDQEAKALPKELIYSETIKDTNEPTIVLHQSDDTKHAYVIWKVQVPIGENTSTKRIFTCTNSTQLGLKADSTNQPSTFNLLQI